MPLSIRPRPYIIPEYSLTGDLLSYLSCGLQYRYYNKGALPPSTPVQLWFGEFIHSVMEEAYRRWKLEPLRKKFPWKWDPDIREIELEVERRLEARGLYAPFGLFCAYGLTEDRKCTCATRSPTRRHQLIASQRTESAINSWGQHLFPLIAEAEVKLKGSRSMPNFQPNISRSNYYGVTGIIDVISSVNLASVPSGNLILHYLHQHNETSQIISNLSSREYEIIIDYKGMRRLATNNPVWQHHEWQILTYVWLRSQQPQTRPIAAGIIFYLNELALSSEDIGELRDDVILGYTDVMPSGQDLTEIKNWKRGTPLPNIAGPFKEQRSIRIIPVNDVAMRDGLQKFDKIVAEIEDSVLSEMRGKAIVDCWKTNPVERTCTACDFKTFCPNPQPRRYIPTVP